MNLPVN